VGVAKLPACANCGASILRRRARRAGPDKDVGCTGVTRTVVHVRPKNHTERSNCRQGPKVEWVLPIPAFHSSENPKDNGVLHRPAIRTNQPALFMPLTDGRGRPPRINRGPWKISPDLAVRDRSVALWRDASRSAVSCSADMLPVGEPPGQALTVAARTVAGAAVGDHLL
jgi:hypothetical protein